MNNRIIPWRKLFPVILLLTSVVITNADRLPQSSILTLDRIHDSEEFQEKRFNLQWLEDGKRYTFIKKAKEGSWALFRRQLPIEMDSQFALERLPTEHRLL